MLNGVQGAKGEIAQKKKRRWSGLNIGGAALCGVLRHSLLSFYD